VAYPFDPAKVPSPEVPQPLTGTYNGGFNYETYVPSGEVAGTWIVGVLDTDYFVTTTWTDADHRVLQLWRTSPITNIPAIVIDTYVVGFEADQRFNTAFNDAGLCVATYPDNWADPETETFALIIERSKSKLKVTKILLQNSSLKSGALFVSQDSQRIFIYDDYVIDGWDLTGAHVLERQIDHAYEEDPYSGEILSFVTGDRLLWKNTTPPFWWNDFGMYSSLEGSSGTVIYPVHFLRNYRWESYEFTWPEYPYEPGLMTGMRPVDEDVTTFPNEVRSKGEYDYTFYVPDYANGERWSYGGGSWYTLDTVYTPESCTMTFSVPWGLGSSYFLAGIFGGYENNPTFIKRMTANGPHNGTMWVNGEVVATNIGYGTGHIYLGTSMGSIHYTEWCTASVSFDIPIPPPGYHDFHVEIDTRWPTDEELDDGGATPYDVLGYGGPFYHSVAGYQDISPPYWEYSVDPIQGRNYSYDSYPCGNTGWMSRGAGTMTFKIDSTDRGGGYYELRDLNSPWGPNRTGATPPLSSIESLGEQFWERMPISPRDMLFYQYGGSSINYRQLTTAGDVLAYTNDWRTIPTPDWEPHSVSQIRASSWLGHVAFAPWLDKGVPT
jgi:hypothetical protein